jgi:hypothetical protein
MMEMQNERPDRKHDELGGTCGHGRRIPLDGTAEHA